MGSSGSLKSIQGARRKRKKLEEQLAELREDVSRRLADQDTRLASLEQTLKQVVDASNAVSVLVNCVEQHLDNTAPGWDDGTRAAAEEKAEQLKRRKSLYREAANAKELPAPQRASMATDLWRLACALGTEPQDVSMVISLYLQARAIDDAKRVVGEIRARGVALPEEVDGLIRQLEERVAALEG